MAELIWSCLKMYSVLQENSINKRCKWPSLLMEAILDEIFRDSSYSLAQSHKCFLLGAHVRKLVDTER